MTTLPLIAQDVEKRNYFFKKAFSLIEKKAEMDLNYAGLLEGIILKDFQKPVNEAVPTQFLYNRLVDYCLEDCRRVRKVGERLRQQSSAMQSLYEKDVPEEKKYLMLGQSIAKDFGSQRDKIEKSRARFEKKSREL